MFKPGSSRVACAALLVAVMAGVAGAVPASAAVGAKRSIKKVSVTISLTPTLTLKGTKGQCLITTDGYNINFEAKDYPDLGADGELSSGGPGPATDPAQRRSYTAFSAEIEGTSYREDDTDGGDAINATVTLNVKKKTIKFDAYPIVDVGTGVQATMSGIVKCK